MIWLNSVNFIELPARHGVSYCGKSSDFSKCLLPARTLVWREGQTFKSASLQGLGDVIELIYRKVGERVINSGIPVAFCGQGGKSEFRKDLGKDMKLQVRLVDKGSSEAGRRGPFVAAEAVLRRLGELGVGGR